VLRREGKGLVESAVEAARMRLRPIVMTSLAFILGVLPLAISEGAGAGARKSIGTSVMGGMLAATFLATIFVPLFFVLVQGASEFRFWRKPKPTEQVPAKAEEKS
jgi:multidrug efflux pump subunit AcrB